MSAWRLPTIGVAERARKPNSKFFGGVLGLVPLPEPYTNPKIRLKSYKCSKSPGYAYIFNINWTAENGEFNWYLSILTLRSCERFSLQLRTFSKPRFLNVTVQQLQRLSTFTHVRRLRFAEKDKRFVTSGCRRLGHIGLPSRPWVTSSRSSLVL